MRPPLFLLLAFVASSLACKAMTQDQYTKNLREYCSISTIFFNVIFEPILE